MEQTAWQRGGGSRATGIAAVGVWGGAAASASRGKESVCAPLSADARALLSSRVFRQNRSLRALDPSPDRLPCLRLLGSSSRPLWTESPSG